MDLSSESAQVVEYVNNHGRISTSEAQSLLGIPRPTVKKRLTQLVNKGFLSLKGKGRGSYYEKGGYIS